MHSSDIRSKIIDSELDVGLRRGWMEVDVRDVEGWSAMGSLEADRGRKEVWPTDRDSELARLLPMAQRHSKAQRVDSDIIIMAGRWRADNIIFRSTIV